MSPLATMCLLLQFRHKTWTKQFPACYDSGAVSEITEGALFLPGAKDERSLLELGAPFIFGEGD